MERMNNLKVETIPGGFVVDEANAPPSQIPLAVPVEVPSLNYYRRSHFMKVKKKDK